MASTKKALTVADREGSEPKQMPNGFSPEMSLPHAFAVVANRMTRMLEKMYSKRFGLSVVGWRIIAILGSRYPLSAKALSELTALDQVSISRALEQLSSKKLVSRRIDTTDRRRVVLRLSKKGEEVYNQVVPVLYAGERALIEGISPSDEEALRRVARMMAERSAHLLGDDCDWQQLEKQYGIGATEHRGESDHVNDGPDAYRKRG